MTGKMMVILALLLAAAAAALPAITPPPAPVKTVPVKSGSSVSCNYRYCDGSTSWCFYWAGVTSYDVSLGPVPGETRTEIGSCGKGITTTVPKPTAVRG